MNVTRREYPDVLPHLRWVVQVLLLVVIRHAVVGGVACILILNVVGDIHADLGIRRRIHRRIEVVVHAAVRLGWRRG